MKESLACTISPWREGELLPLSNDSLIFEPGIMKSRLRTQKGKKNRRNEKVNTRIATMTGALEKVQSPLIKLIFHLDGLLARRSSQLRNSAPSREANPSSDKSGSFHECH